MAMQTNKRWIIVETEGPYGTDAAPDGADAILVTDLNPTPMQADELERNLVRPFLGASERFLTNIRSANEFGVELVGPGSTGVVPRAGRLLQACGFAQTSITPALTGTATAGGINSITFAADASAVNGFYAGMILRITGGAGAGAVGIISSYNGSTRVATFLPNGDSVTTAPTSVYSIDPQTMYTPVSDAYNSVTIYTYIDKIVHRSPGNRGTFSLNAEVAAIPGLNFSMTGLYSAPADVVPPTPSYSDGVRPLVVSHANTGAAYVQFSPTFRPCLHSLSIEIGNSVNYNERVGCNREVSIDGRSITGSALIEAPTIAQYDYFAAAQNSGVFGTLSFVHGKTPGNIVGLLSQRLRTGAPAYEDMNGTQMLRVPFTLVPSNLGNDELRIVYA